MAKRRLPIGIQTFRKLREQNCYYVDKTPYIQRLLDEGEHYFLSRPRRFGKSLFLDTLKELFEGSEELFVGLHIHAGYDWSQRHPVVRLSFGGGSFTEPANVNTSVLAQLEAVAEREGVSARYATAPERFAHLLRTLHIAAETREVSPASSEPVAPAAPRVAAETRVVSLTPAEPGAQTANLGAEQATIAAPHISAETFDVSEAAFERVAPETDLDAGLAVIEQAGGLHLGREAARRVACDAGLVVLHHGAGGEVLDVGRRTRTVPSAMRRALLSRDRGQCQFPGCESRHCDAHHVEHWADGGETRLQNLVLACRFHHRALHEGGFRVVPADTAGQFRFLRPDGTPLPAEPPAAGWEGAPLAPTDAWLTAAGIGIGPHTATPEWYGESLDLTAALDVLWEPPAASWNALQDRPTRHTCATGC